MPAGKKTAFFTSRKRKEMSSKINGLKKQEEFMLLDNNNIPKLLSDFRSMH